PKVEYQAARKVGRHLGLDLAYAPRLAASDPGLRELAARQATVGKLTLWQPGEWTGNCQTAACGSRWRYVRNLGVASGVRALLSKGCERDHVRGAMDFEEPADLV